MRMNEYFRRFFKISEKFEYLILSFEFYFVSSCPVDGEEFGLPPYPLLPDDV